MIFQVGDYNTVPTGLPMIVIRDHAQLVDGWVASHPSHVEIDSSFVVTDPVESIERFGVTADSPLNTWSAGKWLDEHAKQFLGKRLDYVLFRQPEQREGTSRRPLLKCVQSKVVFTDKAPRREFSYSDHFGLEATFHIESTPSDVDASLFPTTQLADADIGTVVHALTTCYRISTARSRKYLSFFVGAVGFLLLIIIGSAWLPRSYANPVVVLVAAVTTWFGTTMLYIGFVYGRWEVNALQNIIEELEIHRSNLVKSEL
jgi:sphingomyelin phosphodiesterase 2